MYPGSIWARLQFALFPWRQKPAFRRYELIAGLSSFQARIYGII